MKILAVVGAKSRVRISVTVRARVPWQCRSAKGQLILTKFLTGMDGKGKRLIFLYYFSMCGNASLVSDALG